MSEQEPTNFYVYQPDPPKTNGRMYGVGGPSWFLGHISNLTVEEAQRVAKALNADLPKLADLTKRMLERT